MTIEHAHAHSVSKPWGVLDPSPWSNAGDGTKTIGEIWYERSDSTAVPPALLLKLLFTSQPLSIQVHPDDAYAQSTGLPNGKTEAWHILDAALEATVGLGMKRRVTPSMTARFRISWCGIWRIPATLFQCLPERSTRLVRAW